MKQEAMNVLLTRRSVRQYQTRQVSEQEMDQVLQAGLYAPTGKNVQGVELVAVQEKELRDRLAALNKSFWDKDMDPYYGAPTIILVLADTVRYTWVEDGSCALCNMLNAAHALGLGACWANQPHWLTDVPAVRAVFQPLGLKEEEDIFGSVSVGYPARPARTAGPRKEGRIALDIPRML